MYAMSFGDPKFGMAGAMALNIEPCTADFEMG